MVYSKVRLAGHPIHTMLVAFPIASYVGALVGFAVTAAGGGVFWLNLGIALSITGAGSAVLAALPGFIDWLAGVPRRSPAKKIGMVHGVLNLAAVGLAAAAAYFYFPDWNGPLVGATLGLALAAAAVALTLPSGFLGWMMVQTYHVGVALTPTQERDETSVQSQQVVPFTRRRGAA